MCSPVGWPGEVSESVRFRIQYHFGQRSFSDFFKSAADIACSVSSKLKLMLKLKLKRKLKLMLMLKLKLKLCESSSFEQQQLNSKVC